MPNLDELTDSIMQWGIDRDFPNGATASGQINKLFEEGGELSGAVTRNQVPQIYDGIGDCFVVLCMICLTTGIDIKEAVEYAYDEIKDRRGQMVNGKFVKEESAQPKNTTHLTLAGYDENGKANYIDTTALGGE